MDLLQEQVRDLYDAEIQYRAKLPDMIDRATHGGLRETLLDISDDTSETIDVLAMVLPWPRKRALRRDLRSHAGTHSRNQRDHAAERRFRHD